MEGQSRLKQPGANQLPLLPTSKGNSSSSRHKLCRAMASSTRAGVMMMKTLSCILTVVLAAMVNTGHRRK